MGRPKEVTWQSGRCHGNQILPRPWLTYYLIRLFYGTSLPSRLEMRWHSNCVYQLTNTIIIITFFTLCFGSTTQTAVNMDPDPISGILIGIGITSRCWYEFPVNLEALSGFSTWFPVKGGGWQVRENRGTKLHLSITSQYYARMSNQVKKEN